MDIDVHQHLWSEPFIEALRRRDEAPCLRGWTLLLDGEAPYEVNPADHDPQTRLAQLEADGYDLAIVSLSSPLGIEWLPTEQATPLLDAFHEGVRTLPGSFGSWASVGLLDLDPDALARELKHGSCGLQLPASAMAGPELVERCAPLFDVLQDHDKPLFVHAGAVAPIEGGHPTPWWPALVPYVSQMHAAWYAWMVAGRSLFPRLRVCFSMLAGLAPAHLERYAARGGERRPVDRDVFLDTSSYGRTAIDMIIRAVSVDALVIGSDRPYAAPFAGDVGGALTHAIRSTNPRRLLGLEGAPHV